MIYNVQHLARMTMYLFFNIHHLIYQVGIAPLIDIRYDMHISLLGWGVCRAIDIINSVTQFMPWELIKITHGAKTIYFKAYLYTNFVSNLCFRKLKLPATSISYEKYCMVQNILLISTCQDFNEISSHLLSENCYIICFLLWLIRLGKSLFEHSFEQVPIWFPSAQ